MLITQYLTYICEVIEKKTNKEKSEMKNKKISFDAFFFFFLILT